MPLSVVSGVRSEIGKCSVCGWSREDAYSRSGCCGMSLDGAGRFFRVFAGETSPMGSMFCHVPPTPRLMRPTSPAPFRAIGRCETQGGRQTTHRRVTARHE